MKVTGSKGYACLSSLLDGLRILVLEDEVLIAMDVEQLCRENGAREVTVFGSLAEVAENFAASFDVAIVDLTLDGASTLDFARSLYRRNIPFVFASGHSDLAEVSQEFPDIALVSKPYSGPDLMEVVAKSARRRTSQWMGEAIT